MSGAAFFDLDRTLLQGGTVPLLPRAMVDLIEQHHQAGREVILATTTPKHLIAPLAEKLGFDDVITTGHSVDNEGRFDGGMIGPFVWSRGKLAAVRDWAQRHGVDLAQSYAYSDSIDDIPLLLGVGHPTAVNPDPWMVLFAVAKRWPIVHVDVSPGVFKVPVVGIELQDLLRVWFRPEFFPYARFDVFGVDHIPRSGPLILVGNHRSYFDVAAIAQVVRACGRPVRLLGKAEIFDVPVIGRLLTAFGGIRVDRGVSGQVSYDAAKIALAGGEMVVLLPEGTIPRGPAFFNPVLKGKTGAARLAAATGAPVIPLGLWGTEKVWPRSQRLPNVTNLLDPPRVRVAVGPPVELSYRSATADTRQIMDAISELLPPQARVPRIPTQDELRATYPGGQLPGS